METPETNCCCLDRVSLSRTTKVANAAGIQGAASITKVRSKQPCSLQILSELVDESIDQQSNRHAQRRVLP